MHLAAMQGILDGMKALYAQGAPINVISASGHTPLSLAVVGGHTRMVRWLLGKKARRTAHRFNETLPSLAAAAGNLKMLKTLKRKEFHLDEGNGHGWTPLMYAAQKSHGELVAWLLDQGAYPNSRTSDGVTPLMFAARSGCTDCLKALLTAGARRDLTSADKQTALDLAESNGHEEAVRLLSAATPR